MSSSNIASKPIGGWVRSNSPLDLYQDWTLNLGQVNAEIAEHSLLISLNPQAGASSIAGLRRFGQAKDKAAYTSVWALRFAGFTVPYAVNMWEYPSLEEAQLAGEQKAKDLAAKILETLDRDDDDAQFSGVTARELIKAIEDNYMDVTRTSGGSFPWWEIRVPDPGGHYQEERTKKVGSGAKLRDALYAAFGWATRKLTHRTNTNA